MESLPSTWNGTAILQNTRKRNAFQSIRSKGWTRELSTKQWSLRVCMELQTVSGIDFNILLVEECSEYNLTYDLYVQWYQKSGIS